jgi:hypothetical protein
MLVKGGEEAESMFSRQISASISSGIGDRQAPSFPAKHIFPFINSDIESTLDQFMSRTQSADTTAQHSNAIGHAEYFIAVPRPGYNGRSNSRSMAFRSVARSGPNRAGITEGADS